MNLLFQMFDEIQMMMIMTKDLRFKQPHNAIEWVSLYNLIRAAA